MPLLELGKVCKGYGSGENRTDVLNNINLSIKAKDAADETEALQKHSAESAGNAGTTNLGALLKAKLDNKNSAQ